MDRGIAPPRPASPRRRRPRRVRVLLVLALALGLVGVGASVLVGASARAGDDGWETVREEDGLRVERRPGRRSACDEVRVTRRIGVSASLAFDVLWDARDERPFVDDLAESRVLRESETERLVYGRVEIPWMRDRAYVVRITRHVDETTGVRELRFGLAEDEPLPASRRVVRLAVLEGAWRVAPVEGALASRLEYRAEIDPGDDVPAWLASRLQRQRAEKVVERYAKRMSERAARLTASAAPLR